MTVPARHVAADATADQNSPEQRHRQIGEEMDQQTQAEMQEPKQPLGPVQPARIVQPFEDKQQTAGCNGQVMPLGEAGEGDIEDETAEEHGGDGNMAGAGRNTEPAHGAGGARGLILWFIRRHHDVLWWCWVHRVVQQFVRHRQGKLLLARSG